MPSSHLGIVYLQCPKIKIKMVHKQQQLEVGLGLHKVPAPAFVSRFAIYRATGAPVRAASEQQRRAHAREPRGTAPQPQPHCHNPHAKGALVDRIIDRTSMHCNPRNARNSTKMAVQATGAPQSTFDPRTRNISDVTVVANNTQCEQPTWASCVNRNLMGQIEHSSSPVHLTPTPRQGY